MGHDDRTVRHQEGGANVTPQEFKERCLADSRLRSLWLDAYDAGLELAAVRTRIGFARTGGNTPDPDDQGLEQFFTERFLGMSSALNAKAHACGIATDPLTVDGLIELIV
jgi:hypothetical protein